MKLITIRLEPRKTVALPLPSGPTPVRNHLKSAVDIVMRQEGGQILSIEVEATRG